jgi:hypothetical protein
MKKFPLLIVALAIVSLVGTLIATTGTGAVESDKALKAQMYVTPIEVDLSLDPGQVYNGKLQVSNSGLETYDFRVTANRFFVKDLTYEVFFDEESAFTQIAEWITFDKAEYRGLKPGGKQEVAYQIKVPQDAPGGGQYAVIFATVRSETTDGAYGIVTDSRVGVKIYAKIAGETRATGEVESVNQPKFYFDGPINSTARVKNTGNVDFHSTHEYTVKSLSGQELFSDSISKRIMPGTVRQVELKWDETPSFGIFKVENKISFLGKTQYSQEKIVIVAPYWLIAVLVAAFLLVVGLIIAVTLFITKKRRHNKILKQHKSTHVKTSSNSKK